VRGHQPLCDGALARPLLVPAMVRRYSLSEYLPTAAALGRRADSENIRIHRRARTSRGHGAGVLPGPRGSVRTGARALWIARAGVCRRAAVHRGHSIRVADSGHRDRPGEPFVLAPATGVGVL